MKKFWFITQFLAFPASQLDFGSKKIMEAARRFATNNSLNVSFTMPAKKKSGEGAHIEVLT